MIRSFSSSIDGKTRIQFIEDHVDKSGFKKEIVGSVMFEMDLAITVSSLFDLYVVPEFRKTGIATKLIKQGIKELSQEWDIRNFSCNIKNSNQGSIALFSKLGFRKSFFYEDDKSYLYSFHL